MAIIVFEEQQDNATFSISNAEISERMRVICNSIFKLLPLREEEGEWQKPLETLTIEVVGMASLFPDLKDLLPLASKLRGLREMGELDFKAYRRTIFECCNLANKVKETCRM